MSSAEIAKPAPPPEDNPADKLLPGEHTLPASWWTSQKVLDFEKKAIFSKGWLYTTHSIRFKKAGDYYSFTFLGMNFFIIKTKSGELKAFHNVCRHRAYPVVRKEKGSSIILGCKYHGWSYNTDGKLTKAPHFNEIEGFDPEANSLFEIKCHTGKHGHVYINFDNTDSAVPFEEFFEGLEDEMNEYDFEDYEYHMSYELDGEFNWKTLMDGYQECYHCPTAHPGLATAFKMETYKVVPKGNYCRHYAKIVEEEIAIPTEEADADEESSWFGFGKKKQSTTKKTEPIKKENPGGAFNGLWCYLFPTNGINCYSPAWYSIRVLPITPTRTILQYDIYTKKGLADDKKKEFVDFLQQVELEDYNLCVATQKNLNQGVYSTGYLHPLKEKGVLYYQGLVKDMVKKHYNLEQEAGKEINPAWVGGKENSEEAAELEALCAKIECQGSNPETKSGLEW
ncbi:hypothetical protein CANARDRAFT_25399 [[Candida] arabinofermentans NRRL YB-2248]|uniref:Choline monooxygenase, chloroplastic n=1 Tax=[Candida] arabinofermentans NRRL YB-2248 TaxID=983967 RepID=A0A1E4SU37_9ASCO|nr:hypothetical protein CANARDRAFT_25399 [[Candida] arabinofermentans NRRL YB-2248]